VCREAVGAHSCGGGTVRRATRVRQARRRGRALRRGNVREEEGGGADQGEWWRARNAFGVLQLHVAAAEGAGCCGSGAAAVVHVRKKKE